MRKQALALLIFALTALCGAPPARAQQFPQNLAPNTVVGRLGIGPGPAQAIPFSTLSALLTLPTILSDMPAFTTLCNPTGILGAAQACPAITATFPLSISGGTLSLSGSYTSNSLIFGFNAGNGTFTGLNNTAVGFTALNALTSGGNNTAIGGQALQHNTTGSQNMALGYNALTANIGGIDNVCVGYQCSPASTSANGNTGVGYQALFVASSGSLNSAFGEQACNALTTGQFNTCVGGANGTGTHSITTGSKNIAVGSYQNATSLGITTGSSNAIWGPCTGLAAGLSNGIYFCDGDGNLRLNWDNTAGNWVQPKTKFTDQIYSTTGTPTIASGACGTTTNGTVGAGSTNQSGFINIGAAATAACTLSWSATLSVAPNSCVFFPGNAAAAVTATTVAWAGAPSTASVVLNGSALANTVYRYLCL